MYPKSIEKLIESFKMLPGVGNKSAERYALLMLEKSEEEIESFANALISAKQNVKPCKICGNYTENELKMLLRWRRLKNIMACIMY